jgi:hypothetical protein
MNISRSLRIICSFYSSVAGLSTLTNISCAVAYYQNGYQALVTAFWIKALLAALTCYFINTFRAREFYYYRNLGFPRTKLWLYTLVLDTSFFIILCLLTYIIR